MNITVEGQHMSVGDSLRNHAIEKIEDIIAKYFNRATEAVVTFAPEGHAFVKVHIFMRVGRDIKVVAEDTETDAYAAFDVAAARVAKQLRRYKRKLRDHHERRDISPEMEEIKARNYTLAQMGVQEEEKDKQDSDFEQVAVPPVIAEFDTEIRTLSVSDAVMHMDLEHENALLFTNAKTGRLNLVYRRGDGNIGWIDPELANAGQGNADGQQSTTLKSVAK